MRTCSHFEALCGRTDAGNRAIAGVSFALPRFTVIYQPQPTTPAGKAILPHAYGDTKVFEGRWDSRPAQEAAAEMADYCRRRLGAIRNLGHCALNIESMRLDTPEARAFWSVVLPAMRAACPGVAFGFYNSPHLADLVDVFFPGIYPIKAIHEECFADGEHEQTPATYRQATHANLDLYPRTKPWYIFASIVIELDDAIRWASTLELREQWRIAQDRGANLVWWGSIGQKVDKDLRRARAAYDWIKWQKPTV